MVKQSKPMVLTEELVQRCERSVPVSDGHPLFVRASDEERNALVRKLVAAKEPGPLWIFAYGSLIWKPEFEFTAFTRAVAHGWHRSFCLELWSWRGTPEQPGLMMALDRGGSCHGIAYRLPDTDHEAQIARIALKLPLDKVAATIARACGHAGSNAAYLYRTVKKLDEHGIRDRNLWRLQELVAAEIEGLTRLEPP